MVEHLVELVVAFPVELEHILMELEQRLSMRDREKGDFQIFALIVPGNKINQNYYIIDYDLFMVIICLIKLIKIIIL